MDQHKDVSGLMELATRAGSATRLGLARVVRVDITGSVIVSGLDSAAGELSCRLLVTSPAGPLVLYPGDDVLVVRGDDVDEGIVLGRVGPSRSAPAEPAVPEELIIEARRNLMLKVGDGSITIREDGKILIKGKDLVSHAQRMNRIKGGSVAIN
jgi:hypothetical protein